MFLSGDRHLQPPFQFVSELTDINLIRKQCILSLYVGVEKYLLDDVFVE
jgi:hypothetical protein